MSSPGEGRSTSISRLKWGDTGTHGLVGGEQRGEADATFLCTPPRSAPIVAWWAFAVERVNQKALVAPFVGLTGADLSLLLVLVCGAKC